MANQPKGGIMARKKKKIPAILKVSRGPAPKQTGAGRHATPKDYNRKKDRAKLRKELKDADHN